MNLYEKKLTDHYHNPRNYGSLDQPHFSIDEYNPSCGDSITIEGIVNGTMLEEVRFTAQGCILSKATASILLQECLNKSIDYSSSLTNHDLLNLLGIELGPLRLKCALIPLQALQNGITSYKNQKNQVRKHA